jgi:hypothetical protein
VRKTTDRRVRLGGWLWCVRQHQSSWPGDFPNPLFRSRSHEEIGGYVRRLAMHDAAADGSRWPNAQSVLSELRRFCGQ